MQFLGFLGDSHRRAEAGALSELLQITRPDREDRSTGLSSRDHFEALTGQIHPRVSALPRRRGRVVDQLFRRAGQNPAAGLDSFVVVQIDNRHDVAAEATARSVADAYATMAADIAERGPSSQSAGCSNGCEGSVRPPDARPIRLRTVSGKNLQGLRGVQCAVALVAGAAV